ncbi:hypothetical protein C8Q80DRAFT_1265815 [Daedaleopsis nitida]|nr:hypothetical protein C8Q80DRAFT_1265815 [Daedaleopsis nitida]
MASFPRWLDKAKATGARLISYEPEGPSPAQRQHKRKRDTDYADIPPFLLPLSVRVRLDKGRRKTLPRPAPYNKTSLSPVATVLQHNFKPTDKRKHKLRMPTVLKRLAGPPTCPIVVAQYKDEYRGVGHEQELHWALVVITDPAAPSAHANGCSTSRYGSGTNAIRSDEPLTSKADGHSKLADNGRHGRPPSSSGPSDPGPEYEIQWYTRCTPASLFDVSATVRSLCLGGVQVGAVRRADVDKLAEYLRSHPPVPRHRAWSSRDYVLELLELLRPFKMLRADLQSIHLRARAGEPREVCFEDLLPDLREVGRATQESIFQEDFRPCVKYSS